MLFTDIVFPLFLTLVFAIYWLALRNRLWLQNLWLLAASYTFYGWWDWRFLALIILTSASTFLTALLARSRLGAMATAANILLNLGILIAFKYFNFFSENLGRLFGLFGINLDWFTLDVLLPVGISFYTFQAISYSVDVYKRRIEPTRNPVAFFTYIAYFPQLVAGPIERATQLLPQILAPRRWSGGQAVTGMRMILFGVMKKVCVANMAAIYVDRLFASGLESAAATVAAGILFTLQIYCDFSAYSEIARGVSRLLGIELMANFRFPYFSRNIMEFWQRWHISLMLWLRDYIYIPLGGNRKGPRRTLINTAIVFLVSGLWHGAAWNFITWGAFWAAVYIGARAAGLAKKHSDPIESRHLPHIILTLGIVTFSFYIFRCSTMAEIAIGFSRLWAFALLFGLAWAGARVARFIPRFVWSPTVSTAAAIGLIAVAVAILPQPWTLLKAWWIAPLILVAAIEWHSRNADHPMALMPRSRTRRVLLYWTCLFMIMISEPVDMAFIYFQF